MKVLMATLTLLFISTTAQALPVDYDGEISASGDYSGTVGNGEDFNFWGLNASAGQTLSVAFDSFNGLIGGAGLFAGEVDGPDVVSNLFGVGDDALGATTYLGFPTQVELTNSLQSFTFDNDGFYTLAVGGIGWEDRLDYTIDVALSSTTVPEASSLLLLSTGLLGVVLLRRRQQHKEKDAGGLAVA